MVKSFSTLHRAQSFKTEEQPVSKIFRPSELIYGELIGRGFFGDVVKVSSVATFYGFSPTFLDFFNCGLLTT